MPVASSGTSLSVSIKPMNVSSVGNFESTETLVAQWPSEGPKFSHTPSGFRMAKFFRSNLIAHWTSLSALSILSRRVALGMPYFLLMIATVIFSARS